MHILLVEDDPFIASALEGALLKSGFRVSKAKDYEQAIYVLETDQPHIVLTDLDLGPGPGGVELVWKVSNSFPWISVVVLTTHRDSRLASSDARPLPMEVSYIVKSDLRNIDVLISVLNESLTSVPNFPSQGKINLPEISRTQAETLLLIGKGLSNQAISVLRGVSLRAVESSVSKLYLALGLATDHDSSQRVRASEIWKTGQVIVRTKEM